MDKNIINLKETLRKLNIVEITELKHKEGSLFYTYEYIEDKYTGSFPKCILNFNRALSIYPEIVKYEQSNPIKFSFLCENILVNLITTLEVYLRDAFRTIAYSNTLEVLVLRYDANGFHNEKLIKNFNKWLKNLRINIRINYDNLHLLKNIKLYAILPPQTYLSFQTKDTIKCAYKLLKVNLAKLFPTLWSKIFSNEPHSYVKLRNIIIHSGPEKSLFGPKIDLLLIDSCFKDIAKFIHKIDKKLIEEFPD